jgi:hypothetical protein
MKTITFTVMQLVIIDELLETGGCNWKHLKDAVEAHGFHPVDWLTQVRGPLQALIDEGRVVRAESDNELYQLKAIERTP